MTQLAQFQNFLSHLDAKGGLRTDDVIAIVMPLLEALNGVHAENRVAHLKHAVAVRVNEERLYLDLEQIWEGAKNPAGLFAKPLQQDAVVVVSEVAEIRNNEQRAIYRNAAIHIDGAALTMPKYLRGYDAWEIERGHHDPLTDIYLCGLILASLTFGLDLNEQEDLDTFVNARQNLFALDSGVHPTLAAVIHDLTALYREDRPRSLDEVIAKLKNFRQFDPDNYVDLTKTAGFKQQDLSARDNWILAKLKSRLFDLSRRNKLLHFRDTDSFINLTVASVPPLLDHKNIDPASLLVWNDGVQEKLVAKKKLPLSNYIDFTERKSLAPKLDKVRAEARKNVNEFGVDQLRVAIAFLQWTNFKEPGEEKMRSPLVLLPVQLIKRKGVKDQYIIECETGEAEVNPVLAHYLRELYNITLPDRIDLEESSVQALADTLRQQAEASGSEIRIELVDKPRIKLIHAAAQQAYSRTLQRSARRNRALDPKLYSYSYGSTDFVPLGLQLYRQKVQPTASAFEYVINEDIRPGLDLAKASGERSFYNTVEEGGHNPYLWEVDLCNVTIGNFNSRKMSLVRDYDHIIAAQASDDVFNRLFGEQPREMTDTLLPAAKLADRHPIIQADPTQTRAIEQAASGKSYIIQGPPGTGKSQTITNLIAYYVGAGKKVLFVCEKRAALDVVFHRLKQRNLDELCCRVHDSQADKKAFILNLKETYESFLSVAMDVTGIEQKRAAVIARMEKERAQLEHFHAAMQAASGDSGIAIQSLFQHLIGSKRESVRELDALTRERTPSYAQWQAIEATVREFSALQGEQGLARFPAAHPLVAAETGFLEGEHPLRSASTLIEATSNQWETISERLDGVALSESARATVADVAVLVGVAKLLAPFASKGQLGIFQAASAEAKRYDTDCAEIDKQVQVLAKATAANQHWRNKLSAEDARNAREQWQRVSTGFFRFLNGTYRSLNKVVKAGYNFSAHQVKPDIGGLFDDLCTEYNETATLQGLSEASAARYGAGDCTATRATIARIRGESRTGHWLTLLALSDEDVLELASIDKNFALFGETAKPLNSYYQQMPLAKMDGWLQSASGCLAGLSGALPSLQAISRLPEATHAFVTQQAMYADEMAYVTALKSLQETYLADRRFDKVDGINILQSVRQLNALNEAYLDVNVLHIRAQVRERFKRNIKLGELSIQGMSVEDRETKKIWTSARRILENEFGKSMRFKSVRELTGPESNAVVMSLKPVWLMSPQSVSDVLPLDTALFDVVIYDEASQITLEEGVPALFRAGQTIIVGDEMQMPPTNFFNTTASDMDEVEEGVEERIGISLDADSLLSQGVRKLSGVMLGWHYRSRHESLISFSNAAFYQRKLLTIPDQRIAGGALEPINAKATADAKTNIAALSDRPISYHHLDHGVYVDRRNPSEAQYIAELIRELIGKGRSIGVVAFSMEQQAAIEEALLELAESDKEFEAQLEEEYARIEEDQFVGLIIKNLENVQGDERDIIILSVCYGPNPSGRMLMNFGPINRRGGEKRLNVIFSRAKKHMAIVSSIRSTDITNDHNEGANYLRKFLLYAERLSAGEADNAAIVLDGLALASAAHQSERESLVAVQIAERLRVLGHVVDRQVGSSYFKCDLAIKNQTAAGYQLGILVDNDVHYRNPDVMEQYCQRPALLRAFGWNIVQVLAKDWFHRPDDVMARIDRALVNPVDTEAPVDLNWIEAVAATPIAVPPTVPEAPLPNVGDSVVPPTLPVPSNASTQGWSRLEFQEGVSNKFWEVRTNGAEVEVRYGRIGTAGQSLTKKYADEASAASDMAKQQAKKMEKGYKAV